VALTRIFADQKPDKTADDGRDILFGISSVLSASGPSETLMSAQAMLMTLLEPRRSHQHQRREIKDASMLRSIYRDQMALSRPHDQGL